MSPGAPSAGLLGRLSDDERADLAGRGAERRYRAGGTLFSEGDASEWVVGVLAGRVKVAATTEEGREVVLAVCTPGELLGELSAIDGRARSATATAIDEVRALIVPVAGFRSFLASRPGVAMFLLESVAGRLRDADRREVEYAALDSVGRVAKRLVELADRFGVPGADGLRIELPISQEELAGWTGCSREAVGKALQTLRTRGWVATGRRSVTVVDLAALQQRAGAQA